jgi:hypothetical protein
MESHRIKTSYAEKKTTHGTSHDPSSFDHTAPYQKEGKKRNWWEKIILVQVRQSTSSAYTKHPAGRAERECEMPLSLLVHPISSQRGSPTSPPHHHHLSSKSNLHNRLTSVSWSLLWWPNGNGQTPNMPTFTPTSPNRNSQGPVHLACIPKIFSLLPITSNL